MRKFYLICSLVLLSLSAFSQSKKWWTKANLTTIQEEVLFKKNYKPDSYDLYQIQLKDAASFLSTVPEGNSLLQLSASKFTISLPIPGGGMERFSIVSAPVMEKGLLKKFPGFASFAGVGLEQSGHYLRCDISPFGFNAMVSAQDGASYYINAINENTCAVFSKSSIKNLNSFSCGVGEIINQAVQNGMESTLRGADDGKLRTYRLACTVNGEYSQKCLNGTETSDAQRISKVLANLNTNVTRANTVYEKDFSVRLVLVSNNDQIIYLNAATDPWTSSSQWNSKTQTTIDNVIGSSNYDIGHLLAGVAAASGNNGNAGCIGCVCKAGQKGSAFTAHTDATGDPLVIDYWTHEMGHQFGANHTFTFQTESAGANMEPGSGSTIMGYAGITGSTDVQPHSDPYFHAKSIEQVTDYIKSTSGNCAVQTNTGNNVPTANAGADYTIPKSTPFVLTGSATDANGDALTFCWEQYDNYASGANTFPSATSTKGPVFRSFNPTTSSSRTFPSLSTILAGNLTNTWEALPSVARTLNFRMTVRDNRAGGGQNANDNMLVTVSSTTGPFSVSAPNTAVTWSQGSTQTVSWNLGGSNGSPVNCANVKISLSTDGGSNFSTVLLASTPNDGSQSITVPSISSTQCRIKVEAVGNIFFDISNVNFTISSGGATCNAPTGLSSSSITTSGATVLWSAVSGATNYTLEYKTTAASSWTTAASATTATSQAISGLSASTTYDWRVKTNCSSSSSAYSSAQFTTSSVSGGCTTANEPNESLAAAATVATNTNISGAINTGTDKDWYKFTLSATSNLTITLSTLPADYDIIFYNSAGTEIKRSELGSTSTETISNTNTAAGTYYLQIFGYNGANSTSCYTLNVGASTATGCQSSYDNNNESFGAAVSIPFNTDVKGLLNPSGDNDYYKFIITNGGTITVSLTTLPADYDIRLYNSAQTQVATSQKGGTTSESISYTATAGTYYVKVYGYNNANNASSCYTLKVQLGTASRNNSQTITGIQVSPNPAKDYIKIEAKQLSNESMLHIYNAQGNMVKQELLAAGANKVSITSLSAGVYNIILFTKEGIKIGNATFIKE